MRYSVDKNEQYIIFSLEEEKLDSALAPNLKSELVTFHAEGVQNVILDMGSVKYTDSSGLSALLVGNRVFSEEGGIFILTKLNDHVQKLIQISQLDNVLNILPTVEESVDAVFMHVIESDLTEEGEEESDA